VRDSVKAVLIEVVEHARRHALAARQSHAAH
jgi:hypothetical protein